MSDTHTRFYYDDTQDAVVADMFARIANLELRMFAAQQNLRVLAMRQNVHIYEADADADADE